MNFHETQRAFVEGIAAELPENLVREVRSHRGQFTSRAEIQKIAVKSPCILLAYRGFTGANDDFGETRVNVQWVAYILTQDTRDAPRHDLASLILTALLKIVPGNDWADTIESAEKISGRNITSTDIDDIGISLWVVAWQQLMKIDALDVSALDNLLTIHGDHFGAGNFTDDEGNPAPLASDTVTLPQN